LILYLLDGDLGDLLLLMLLLLETLKQLMLLLAAASLLVFSPFFFFIFFAHSTCRPLSSNSNRQWRNAQTVDCCRFSRPTVIIPAAISTADRRNPTATRIVSSFAAAATTTTVDSNVIICCDTSGECR
jgi:hypothetical protein